MIIAFGDANERKIENWYLHLVDEGAMCATKIIKKRFTIFFKLQNWQVIKTKSVM